MLLLLLKSCFLLIKNFGELPGVIKDQINREDGDRKSYPILA